MTRRHARARAGARAPRAAAGAARAGARARRRPRATRCSGRRARRPGRRRRAARVLAKAASAPSGSSRSRPTSRAKWFRVPNGMQTNGRSRSTRPRPPASRRRPCQTRVGGRALCRSSPSEDVVSMPRAPRARAPRVPLPTRMTSRYSTGPTAAKMSRTAHRAGGSIIRHGERGFIASRTTSPSLARGLGRRAEIEDFSPSTASCFSSRRYPCRASTESGGGCLARPSERSSIPFGIAPTADACGSPPRRGPCSGSTGSRSASRDPGSRRC